MQKTIQTKQIFSSVLKAREERWQTKLSLSKHGWHLVSLQINLAGYPKTVDETERFMKRIDDQFIKFIHAHAPTKYKGEKKAFVDQAGECIIYLIPEAGIRPQELKDLTELFEERHELGRLIDLDVMDSKGQNISSGKIKGCFICESTAEECRKTNAHNMDHVRTSMLNAIGSYLCKDENSRLIDRISSYAIKALLYEASLTPKPGLVCRNSVGAHSDMDYLSFINSVSALSPYFKEVARIALEFKSNNVALCLPQIREVGLKMEEAMLRSTDNVNTHKGAIFLMALSVFAAVRVILKKKAFKPNLFSSVIQQLCRGMIQRELCALREGAKMSHGESCFLKFGLQGAGARGEAEQGFPTVMHHALPFMREHNINLIQLKDSEMFKQLVPVLLKIISVNNDTNVLYRHDKGLLEDLKLKSKEVLVEVLNGGNEGYYQLVEWCNANKISPGGSADLLSIAMFVSFCQND